MENWNAQDKSVMEQLRHLLFNLAEACESVAQRANDAAFLGMDAVQPGQTLTNEERLWNEMNDVAAFGELLASLKGQGGLSRAAVAVKKAKVEVYLRYPSECDNCHGGQAENEATLSTR